MLTITIKNLSHVYPGGIEALKDVDLTIEPGECVLLYGHNGAGKTTLLKHLNGILKPTSGDVLLGERNTREYDTFELAHYVALSFQNPDEQIFSTTVIDEVAYGPKNLGKSNFLELVKEELQSFDLTEVAAYHPYDLHPAKRKLLTLASATAMDTPILAFDEPTAGFDMRQKRLLRQVFDKLKRRKKTVVIASHDIDYFMGICDSIILMKEGQVHLHDRKVGFASRPDKLKILRKSGLAPPILWRMSRALGLEKVASSVDEFARLLLVSRASRGI